MFSNIGFSTFLVFSDQILLQFVFSYFTSRLYSRLCQLRTFASGILVALIHVIIVCKNSLYKLFLLSPKKMQFKIFGFSIFNIKNGCISTLVSSRRVEASFITSKFSEHNTENEEFEKSRVLQKCPLMHITLIIIIMMMMIYLLHPFLQWHFVNVKIYQ